MGKLKSIREELLVLFSSVLVVGSVAGVIIYLSITNVSNNFKQFTRELMPVTLATQEALIALEKASSRVNKSAFVDEFDYLSDLQKYEAEFNSAVLEYRIFTQAIIWGSESDIFKNLDGGIIYSQWVRSGFDKEYVIPKAKPESARHAGEANIFFGAFVKRSERIFSLQKRILRLGELGEDFSEEEKELRTLLDESQNVKENIRREMRALIDSNKKLSQANFANIEKSIEGTKYSIVFAVIFGVTIVIILENIFAQKVIIIPIKKLQKGSQEIASGNYDFKVNVESSDEIGALARDFNLMAGQLKARDRQINELNETLRIINKTMRHDILNDFTVTMGNIDTYLELGEPKDVKIVLKQISKATHRGKVLIDQMRDLEQAVTSGGQLLDIDPSTVISAVAKNFEDLSVKIKGESKKVKADQAFSSLVLNIFRNAAMHGRARQIEVTFREVGQDLEVRFADDGRGIPDEVKGQLFQEGAKFGETGHTGLGLYIIKKTITRYNGSIAIEDNKPRGAVFVVKIPKA